MFMTSRLLVEDQQIVEIIGHFPLNLGPLLLKLTLISAWISNHVPRKVWVEITYSFLNFNSCTFEV